MSLLLVESQMWENTLREVAEVSKKSEQRILTEINREKLPIFVEAIRRPGYLTVQPIYQRRKRWTRNRQSKLIESLIVNIPIPPVVLYETSLSSYEVMDGQQRINAIRDFYSNKFKLTGLEIYTDLNGCHYDTLPSKIRSSIDRRSIASIVVIHESAETLEEEMFLKQLVFERLNTGGVNLSRHEVRNCIYQGEFNNLIKQLAETPIFRSAWGIPNTVDIENDDLEEDEVESDGQEIEKLISELEKNNLYQKMGDAELVLRFFALRNVEYFKSGLEKFLDLYMAKSLKFSSDTIESLRRIFMDTLELAYQIYGEYLFKPFLVDKNEWASKPYNACYDAEMVGLSRHLEDRQTLLQNKHLLIDRTVQIFQQDSEGILTGRGKKKSDIQERIRMFDEMFSEVARISE
jgi:uncharacterized protein with ParB-like and HNH nuclease domain